MRELAAWHHQEERGDSSEGGGGIWERQQELLGGGVGLRGRLSQRSCRSRWKSTSNLVQLNSSFVQSEDVHAKIQGALLEEIKIISLIRVGCMGLLLPWLPCRRGLRACGTGPAATLPSTQGAGGRSAGFRRSVKQSCSFPSSTNSHF